MGIRLQGRILIINYGVLNKTLVSVKIDILELNVNCKDMTRVVSDAPYNYDDKRRFKFKKLMLDK